jgi:hypothetical protein
MRCEATELGLPTPVPGDIRPMELEALGPQARRRVIRAVRKGAAVEDRAEARAAVAHARWVQPSLPRNGPGGPCGRGCCWRCWGRAS